MKRWLKRTLIGVFGATLLVGGLAACANRSERWQTSAVDSARMRERIMDKASRELQLNDAQKAKLGQLADAIQAQRQALVADGANPRAEIQALVAGPQFDRSKAQALIEGKTAAVRDKSPVVVAAMADFYDSLQPDQQQKVREFMARGRGHRWHG